MGRIFVRLVAGGIVGKLLGIAREVLLAALFGVGRVVAANRIALTATLIPINFFTADALTAGFLPLYVQYRKQQPALAARLYRSVRSLLMVLSGLLTLALIIGSAAWVGLLGPGLDVYTSNLAAQMLAIAALGVPFYVQFNLYTLVALANDDVRLINLRASMQSVGLICATLAAYLTGRASVLALGFTVPYVLLFCWGAYWVHRKGYLGTAEGGIDSLPGQRFHGQVLTAFWHRLRPLLIVPVILQGSIAVERAVGSLLGTEVVAASEYARFIVDSLMALVAAPLGLASLASFSKIETAELPDRLRRLIAPVLLTMIPLSLLICVNSRGIVTLLYARGQFATEAVDTTSVMLLGFGLAIWAQVLGYTLVKVLNARGENYKATLVLVASFAAAIGFNLALYRYLGAFTLGAAASVASLIMFVAAAWALRVVRHTAKLLAIMLPGLIAAAIAGYVLSGPGLGHLVLASVAIVLVWGAYVSAVPRLRAVLHSEIIGRLRRSGPARTNDSRPKENV